MTNPPLIDLGLEQQTQLDLGFVYVGDSMCDRIGSRCCLENR